MLQASPESLLVLDIETVSQCADHSELSDTWKELWAHKAFSQLPDGDTPASLYSKKAAIWAEFGKIVCISMGIFVKNKYDEYTFRVKSFYGHDECRLLREFLEAVEKCVQREKNISFCGHNIREFDIPYICRRLLINQECIPEFINFQSKKPWEVNMVDTLQCWKFGDNKSYVSLNLLAACLGIPSPKDDIDGSQVGHVYWKENDLVRIARYCEQDVITVAQVYLCMKNMPLLKKEAIVISKPDLAPVMPLKRL
jgi:hypothetical protein